MSNHIVIAYEDATGGFCLAHGEYIGDLCQQWPLCAFDKQPFKDSPEVEKWKAKPDHKIIVEPI